MTELEMVDPRILGGRIAEFRKACGKTQEETGKHLGMSRPTYIAIEKGFTGVGDFKLQFWLVSFL